MTDSLPYKLEEVVVSRSFSTENDYTTMAFFARFPSKLTTVKLNLLCDLLPLNDMNLGHLKRVKKKREEKDFVDILIGTEQSFNALSEENKEKILNISDSCLANIVNKKKKLSKLVKAGAPSAEAPSTEAPLENQQESIKKEEISVEIIQKESTEIVSHALLEQTKVGKYEPMNRQEFELFSEFWPINFHPSELAREREKGLEKEEIVQINSFVEELLKDHQRLKDFTETDSSSDIQTEKANSSSHYSPLLSISQGGIMVDPQTGKVVCSSFDITKEIFSRLCPQDQQELRAGQRHPLYDAPYLLLRQVGRMLTGEIPGRGKMFLVFYFVFFSNFSFFSLFFLELLSEMQYLSTNLDIYLYEEPKIFSSMCLVHSRIRRAYVIKSIGKEGGFFKDGNIFLHALTSLNHRYRVFEIQPKE